MLQAQWDGPEIRTDGEVKEGDKYPGFCCEGHDWEVAVLIEWPPYPKETDIWGRCDNPACPNYDEGIGPHDAYRGVGKICLEDFEEWLADESTRIYNAHCSAGVDDHGADFEVCKHPDCMRMRMESPEVVKLANNY